MAYGRAVDGRVCSGRRSLLRQRPGGCRAAAHAAHPTKTKRVDGGAARCIAEPPPRRETFEEAAAKFAQRLAAQEAATAVMDSAPALHTPQYAPPDPFAALSAAVSAAAPRQAAVPGLAEPAQRDLRGRLRVFSGTANPELAKELGCYLGMDLGKMSIKRFADGEVYVRVEESIRGCDVFIVQPTCPPTNDNLMELLVMIDACRRASARSVTAVIPYFGYARADRKTSGRESIAAKLVANMLTKAGCSRALLLDLHSLQTIGYFDIPVDHVYGECVMLDYLTSKALPPGDMVVVSPDVGGVTRARAFAKRLNDAPLAIIDKRRTGHNQAEVMNLIGDVEGKVAIMLDDMIDTAGTLQAGARLLRQQGARSVFACATHAVFSPPALERLSSELFDEVIVTNTIPIDPKNYFPQLTVLSVANLLGETVWRVHSESPLQYSSL